MIYYLMFCLLNYLTNWFICIFEDKNKQDIYLPLFRIYQPISHAMSITADLFCFIFINNADKRITDNELLKY